MASTGSCPPKASDIAARLMETTPLLVGVGDAGCLMDCWLDADRHAFLAMLDGACPQVLAWDREDGLLHLRWRPLGVAVAAEDPTRLMDGLDYLSDRADHLLPRSQKAVEAEADPDDPGALRRELSVRLREDLAVVQAARPLGVRFAAAAMAAPHPVVRPDLLGPPEVQDHRAVVPPRRRSS